MKRMTELENTRATLESKISSHIFKIMRIFDLPHISALTKLILRGGFANGTQEEEEQEYSKNDKMANGNGHHAGPSTPQRTNPSSNTPPRLSLFICC